MKKSLSNLFDSMAKFSEKVDSTLEELDTKVPASLRSQTPEEKIEFYTWLLQSYGEKLNNLSRFNHSIR